MSKILKFPNGFLWGVSTSAYQIEGGIVNDWSEWEKTEFRIKNLEFRGFNHDDFICGNACDSYNKYEEDFDLAKDMGCGAFRLGIEWARVEPQKGKYNMEEIEHYRKVLKTLRARGLKSVVTLWHWTNPVWLAAEGGWTNKKVVEYFSDYTELIVKELGDLIDFWITLNEPMIHVVNGYLTGKFPPAKKFRIYESNKVFNNLISAHKNTYEIIHKKYPQSQVSITALVNYSEPARRWCLTENVIAKAAHYLWNDRFLQKIKNHLDFAAFDYYFHDRIVWHPPFIKNINKKVTDMGWEIYPEGIYHVIKYLSKFKKPIYIMENGIADADDDQRPMFIREHLRYVHKAIAEGADVRGYFCWSLLDNFEWAAGWAPKFGLFEVDRKTFKRTPRPSVALYADICKNNRVVIS
jgi:beta-glucosidase